MHYTHALFDAVTRVIMMVKGSFSESLVQALWLSKDESFHSYYVRSEPHVTPPV